MNQKHPYEKHLAEKLVQLPPPDDPDQNWQRMKALLDKNMPRGGGGSGGSYRWWITGTVIVAVVIGTWFGGKTFLTREQRNESVAGTIRTVNNGTAPSVASTEKNAKQPGGFADADNTANGTAKPKKNLPGAAYASSTSPTGDDNTSAADQPVPVTTGKANQNNYSASKQDVAAATNNSAKNNSITIEEAEKARSSGNNENNPRLLTDNNNPATTETPSSYHNKTSPDRNKIYSSDSKNNKISTGNDRVTNTVRHHPANRHAGIEPNEAAVVTNAAGRKVTYKKGKNPVKKTAVDENGENTARKVEVGQNRYTYKPKITLPSQPSTGSELKESPVTYTINYTGASVVPPSGVIQREFTYYTQADLFPDMGTRNKQVRRKSSRESTSPEDKSFAFGFSLPLGFPVGDQQALGYNRNAGVNTISDFIPSPHFQYHFNDKTYIQAGLQFSAPQFIRPVLLYQDQKIYQQGPNWNEQTTSISARKLYYFNLPLTIYHSPLKNFYLGAGLQYSSLLSGIAYYEKVERRGSMVGPPQEYVIKNYFSRFSHDSLSNRLNGNEVRLLIDMSYYWSRFTVGLQYNQAFNNYVSFQVTPTSPYTFDKNKSLQFYLRYNIWEDKKRKQPKGQSMLTLK